WAPARGASWRRWIWRAGVQRCARSSSAWSSQRRAPRHGYAWGGSWWMLETQPLLLARPAIDGRVTVLRTGLAREEHQLLGTVAVGVDVGDERQALALQLPEPQLGDLNRRLLVRRQNDPCLAQHRHGPPPGLLSLRTRDHSHLLLQLNRLRHQALSVSA